MTDIISDITGWKVLHFEYATGRGQNHTGVNPGGAAR